MSSGGLRAASDAATSGTRSMQPFPPVSELVPHAPPSLALDRVLACDDASIRCELTVGPSSPFARGGRVRAVVAIEYMAQAAAAWIGLRSRRAGERGDPRPGYLVHVRQVDLDVTGFEVGDVLWVEVERTGGDADLGGFRGSLGAIGEPSVARAELSVLRRSA